MAEERTQRRLAAIMAADVVGYSRLLEQDEAGTLAALRTRRRDILNPLVAGYHGRIVKVMGDGVLVEFGSAVNAVACAVELQNRMTAANNGLAEDRRVALRIGINLGDVIVERGDLYGDGVVICVRLQAMAAPGGICVSRTVHDQVGNKLPLAFEDLGPCEVKNITKPVRVFRVCIDRDNSVRSLVEQQSRETRPSIAVLPFANMSGDPEQEYFSDGITEDVITELSRFHGLLVIARNSSFAFKGKSARLQDVARELSVKYVVEGSVRRAADRVRISAQLIDAGTGNHLWAERYDREMRDIFALQEEVAQSVASTVSGRVEAARRDRAAHLSEIELKAYDFLLRAKALMSKYSRANNEQALIYAERAIEFDPTSARAHAHAAWCLRYEYMWWWTADRADTLARSYELAKRAVDLDETDSFAHCILGIIHLARREFDEARLEIEKAIELNPNDPEARRYLGYYLAATGSPEAGIEQMDVAKRLNPFDTRWVPWIRGIGCFTARRYDEAITAFRQARDTNNELRGWLAASYAQVGRLQEAQATLEEFLRIAESDMAVFPGRRLRDWEQYWHGAFEYRDQKDFDHLFDALHKAGMQE